MHEDLWTDVISIFVTFENNFWIKHDFTTHLKERYLVIYVEYILQIFSKVCILSEKKWNCQAFLSTSGVNGLINKCIFMLSKYLGSSWGKILPPILDIHIQNKITFIKLKTSNNLYSKVNKIFILITKIPY